MANQDWQRKVAEWLRGRQGPDDIVIFCTNLALVLVVINLFARTGWLGWVALALIAYAVFRIQSKNLGARARENAAFLKALGPEPQGRVCRGQGLQARQVRKLRSARPRSARQGQAPRDLPQVPHQVRGQVLGPCKGATRPGRRSPRLWRRSQRRRSSGRPGACGAGEKDGCARWDSPAA